MTSTMRPRRHVRGRLKAGGLVSAPVLAVIIALLFQASPLSARSAAHHPAARPDRAATVSRDGDEHGRPRNARDTAGDRPAATTPPKAAAGTHLMVDLASAPSLRTVRSWQRTSPYRAIGVYVHVAHAVDDRHDKVQRHLTASWVKQVQAGGWHVLPIYLGAQAPARCQLGRFHAMSASPLAAQRQGIAAADVAARSTARLGLTTVPVMYDMEQYGAGCGNAVRAFFLGWTARLHQLGRLSGIYGAPTSLGRDLLGAGPDYARPDVLWSVTANGVASTALHELPRQAWRGQRANQFALDVTRRYGGHRLAVDDSAVDDGVWTLVRARTADTTPPVLTVGDTAAAGTRKRTRLRWAAVDEASARVSYQTRVRRTVAGAPVSAWTAPAPANRTMPVRLRQGEQVCVRVRATDSAGNSSGWIRRCTSRLADDRTLRHQGKRARGWRRARARGAYRGTVTTAKRRHAKLRLGHAEPGAVGVLLRGRGAVTVRSAGKRVGVLRAGGLRWARLRHAGAVTLTATSAKVSVDGYVLSPR